MDILLRNWFVKTADGSLKDVQEKLEPGDILQSSSTTNRLGFPERMIRKINRMYQHSPFSHAAIYVGDGSVVHAGRKPGSLKSNVFKERLKDFSKRYDFKALRVKTDEKTKDDAVKYVKKQLGKDFNMGGVVRIAFPFKGESKSGKRERKDAAEAFFCSELVANAYNDVNMAKRKKLQHIMPIDFHKSPLTKQIALFQKEKTAQVDAYQQEEEWSCSAATLTAAIGHLGDKITEKEAIEAVGTKKGRGAETTDIVEGAKKLGYEAYEKSFRTMEEAKKVLKGGHPIIADVQSFNYPGKGHYVLIAGYHPGKGFIIMDPNTKSKTAVDNWRLLSTRELTDRWWDRAMAPPHNLMIRWGVVVSKKAEKEKTAEDESFVSRHRNSLGLGVGTVAGVGAYLLGRRVKLSKDPVLRAMQVKSKGNLTHLDVLPKEMEGVQRPPLEGLFRGGKVVSMSEEEAAKRSAAIARGEAQPLQIRGAIQTAASPDELRAVQSDLPLSTTPKEFMSGELRGKLREAEYLRPTGIAAKSESAAPYLKTRDPDDMKTLDALQEQLSAQYPKGYVVKPTMGSFAPGVPTHEHRFADILQGKGSPEHQQWMKELLRDPDKYMVQEHVPIAKERALLSSPPVKPGEKSRRLQVGAEVPVEYRVHAYGGRVVPGASVHRWAGGSELSPLRRKEIREMENVVQGAIDKLPVNREGIPMAMDVVRTPSGEWRIIEGNIGTQSGFMGPQVGRFPLPSKPGHALYKAVTGRQSPLEAGIKATAVGGATTALTRSALKEGEEMKKTAQSNDIFGWKALARAKAENSRHSGLVLEGCADKASYKKKLGQSQMASFFDELDKIAEDEDNHFSSGAKKTLMLAGAGAILAAVLKKGKGISNIRIGELPGRLARGAGKVLE